MIYRDLYSGSVRANDDVPISPARMREHRASTPQLVDFDQTVVLESARNPVRPIGMDRIELLLLGIIVGLAVLAIVALFAGRMPF